MPSEKGKSRGRKRKAIVEASEEAESQDSPLTQGKGEKYVPRFSTKRARNPRAKSKPCTPAEKLQVAENAATDQSGEALVPEVQSSNSNTKEPLAVEDLPKLDSHDSQDTLAEVATVDVEKKTASNSGIAFIPGLALSQGVSSPVFMATEAPQVDSKVVDTDSVTLSSNVEATQCTGKSNSDKRMASCELGPTGEDEDEKNLNLLDPFRDELDVDTESTSTELVTKGDQQSTAVPTVRPLDLDEGRTHNTLAELDADLHVPLPLLSPAATLPNSQSSKEHTELSLPESLYDGNTSDGKLPEDSKTSLMSTSSEEPLEFATSVSELEGVNVGTQLPSQLQNTPIQPNITAPKSSPNSTPCKRQRLKQGEEESHHGQEQDEFAAVQEMMDLTAADLAMESQLLGEGDEATVPSCSPASKWSQRQNVTPGSMLLQQPLQCLQKPGTHSEESQRPPLEMGEGTKMLRGLIEELSAINQYIMNCKRELDGARKQRSAWLKSQKGRKGR